MSAEIKPGKLRERIKKGELDPKDVLEWFVKQVGPDKSPTLERWLRNRILLKKKQVEEAKKQKEQPAGEKKPRQRGKSRRRRKRKEQS